MKTIIFIVLTCLITVKSKAQFEKGSLVFTLDGNYVKANSTNGVTTNSFGTQGKYLTIGTTGGIFVTKTWVIGIGIDYRWDKEIRINSWYNTTSAKTELLTLRSHAYLPNLYFGYYIPIINKLYFNLPLKFKLGNLHSEYSTYVASVSQIIDADPVYQNYIMGSEGHNDATYFETSLQPELSYFIFPKLALNLGLGGIDYSLINWKNDDSEFAINFNPKYWEIGIKIKL